MTFKMTAMAAMVFAAAGGAHGEEATNGKPENGTAVLATNTDLTQESSLTAAASESLPSDPASLLKGIPSVVEEIRRTRLTLFLAPSGSPQKPLVIVDGLSGKTCIQQFGATASDVLPFVCHDTSALPETDLSSARKVTETLPSGFDETVTEGNAFRHVIIGNGQLGSSVGLQMTYNWRAEGAELCTQIIQTVPDAHITDVGCRPLDTEEIMNRFPSNGPKIKV